MEEAKYSVIIIFLTFSNRIWGPLIPSDATGILVEILKVAYGIFRNYSLWTAATLCFSTPTRRRNLQFVYCKLIIFKR